MPAVLVTGASGFVGTELCRALGDRGYPVRGAIRGPNYVKFASRSDHVVGDINALTDWSAALRGIGCVIHCAARTHITPEAEGDVLSLYHSVNVEGTRRLAEQAAGAGVRRLVYVSTVKVHAESRLRNPSVLSIGGDASEFAMNMTNHEVKDPYGISKWEAEKALWAVAAATGLEVVVVRPPLIYGPGVKGNLARLLKLMRSGVPLPFGSIQNQRSMIGLSNLADLLVRCVDHPAAGGQTLLASDGEDVSTPDLLRLIAAALGRSARLVSVPVPLLRWVGWVLSKQGEIDRLVGSLKVDSRRTRELLGWTPPATLADGIRLMVGSHDTLS